MNARGGRIGNHPPKKIGKKKEDLIFVFVGVTSLCWCCGCYFKLEASKEPSNPDPFLTPTWQMSNPQSKLELKSRKKQTQQTEPDIML